MKNYIHQRNLDLCDAARRIAAEGALSLEEVADRLMECEAPGYYVSRDYAYTAVLQMRRDGMAGKRPAVRARWKAFDAAVADYMSRHRYVSLLEAVDYVAHEVKAPGFFLEKASLLRMLRYMNRQSRLLHRRDLLGVNRNGIKYIRHSPRRARA